MNVQPAPPQSQSTRNAEKHAGKANREAGNPSFTVSLFPDNSTFGVRAKFNTVLSVTSNRDWRVSYPSFTAVTSTIPIAASTL